MKQKTEEFWKKHAIRKANACGVGLDDIMKRYEQQTEAPVMVEERQLKNSYDYDVLVIGGGAAGLTSAITAARFGKKTLIIEKRKTGGECTWFGCIPSKAIIHSAQVVHDTMRYRESGFFSGDIQLSPTRPLEAMLSRGRPSGTPEKRDHRPQRACPAYRQSHRIGRWTHRLRGKNHTRLRNITFHPSYRRPYRA